MGDLTPIPSVIYLDEPLGNVPYIDASAINPSEYSHANYNLWDAPPERSYEFIEGRWIEASEAERIHSQIAEKKRLAAWIATVGGHGPVAPN